VRGEGPPAKGAGRAYILHAKVKRKAKENERRNGGKEKAERRKRRYRTRKKGSIHLNEKTGHHDSTKRSLVFLPGKKRWYLSIGPLGAPL